MSIEDDLVLCTVRLQTENSIGTGFFYKMNRTVDEMFKPVIVTNRHVLAGKNNLRMIINSKEEIGYIQRVINLDNIQDFVYYHPNPQIDLAVIAASQVFIQAEEQGINLDTRYLNENLIAKEEDFKDISPIEDVLVVGYPDGLWDQFNNRPLVRKGVTASDFKLDYNGEPQFIIDCTIIPGSSGSPVFLYRKGTYDDGNGNFILNHTLVKLLGINASVYIQLLDGKVIQKDIEIKSESTVQVKSPINLGKIIKATELKAIEPLLPD